MAESLTEAEERALYGDPSKRSPVEVEVASDPRGGDGTGVGAAGGASICGDRLT